MSYVDDRLEEISHDPNIALRRLGKIEKCKSRHGKTCYYYREGRGSRIRLPDRDIVSPEVFQRAYNAACRGVSLSKQNRSPVVGELAKPGRPGYVYFLQSGLTVKIGFTTRIKERISQLQVGNAEGLKLLMVMPATDETEKFFHTMFNDFRIGGEWFSLVGVLADFVGYKV